MDPRAIAMIDFVIAKRKQLLTTGAAGRALGVTSARVRQLVVAGELPAEIIGERFAIPADAVETAQGRRDAEKADAAFVRGARAAEKADRAFVRAARAEGRDPNDPRHRPLGIAARALVGSKAR